MKRFINFGSIEQFKQIVKHVQHTARYVGLDADGKVQYNNNAKMPVLKATGNEKIQWRAWGLFVILMQMVCGYNHAKI